VSTPPGRLVLLGHPVAHSLSPKFQTAALRAAKIECTYTALDVEPSALDQTLDRLIGEQVGGNVTVPHKQAVFVRCDARTPMAERTGAVNTFWVQDGRLHGDNTDVAGFADAALTLLGNLRPGLRVALLGAGGAARAASVAVADWPEASLHIWNRTPSRAEALVPLGPAGRTSAEEFLAHAVRGADLVVNATSIGLHDDQIVVNPGTLSRRTACLDLVYRPGLTPWIQLARAQGRRADDGLTMLLSQGAAAFERWFGIAPDREVMRTAVAGARRA
jgi:shikimate dehydrogenase